MAELEKMGKSVNNKRFMNTLFIGLMGFVELIIFFAIVYVMVQLIKNPGDEMYNYFAMVILLLWFGILIGYYAWAIYFYNINLGLTNEDWKEIREKRHYAPDAANVPDKNPNAEETFSLPPGTVRGSLALTLMVGGISMTIAGFGMENMLSENVFLVDNFDFFKNAFLMMIAFYFGNKSLELLGNKNTKIIRPKQGTTSEEPSVEFTNSSPTSPVQDASKAKQLLKQVDLNNPPSGVFTKSNPEENDFDIKGSVQ